ncbi:MAG: hypothetical protein CMO30_01535 [Tistrella sp.]|nr:hypothetical protein [Tistrella sp.]MBA73962.1 hypothetical protein [Tistrella sp.]
MYRHVYSPNARRQLTTLYGYIAEASGPERARGYLQRIDDFCGLLATFPRLGRNRSDVMPGLRVAVFERRVTIAYRHDVDRLTVIDILYRGRNVEAYWRQPPPKRSPQFRSRPPPPAPRILWRSRHRSGCVPPMTTTSANSPPANTSPADRRVGFACLAGAMVLVGTTVIASRVIAGGGFGGGGASGGMGPFTATALRFALAFPVFLLLMRWQGVRLPRPAPRDLAVLVVQAGAGSVGYTTLLISGLARTSAADAGVVIGTLPVVTAMIAVLVLGERPGRRLLVAIALAAAGMMAVAGGGADGRGAGDGGTSSLAGNLLVLGAVVCEGVFILLNKRLRTPIAPLALSTVMTGLGFIAAGLPALILERPWAAVPETAALLGVAWYALVPTVIGFVLWYAGAARVSGAEAAPFTALAPVSAVALAALVLGEAVSLPQILGVACVLAALAVLQLPKLQLPKLQLPNWASWRRR